MQTAALILAAGLVIGTAANDPLTRPITGPDAARWLEPDVPARVWRHSFYAGPRRVKQAAIETGQGLVLIDAGLPEGLPQLRSHLAQFGYRLDQVRWLLVTEPHYDHAGAIAAVVRESGAKVYASAATAQALARGISGPEDPQAASLIAYPPVRGVRVVTDGTRLRFGRMTITAKAMPGHTPGSMGWSWPDCAGRDCAQIMFAASLNPLTAGSYRYVDHPDLIRAFRRTIARLATEPCDILLSNHAEHSGADQRQAALLTGARPNAMRDPAACKAMSDKYSKALDGELAREAAIKR